MITNSRNCLYSERGSSEAAAMFFGAVRHNVSDQVYSYSPCALHLADGRTALPVCHLARLMEVMLNS